MQIQNLIRPSIPVISKPIWGNQVIGDEYLVLKWGQNPYPPPQVVIDDIASATKNVNQYPNLMNSLLDKLAKYASVLPNQVILTNGADKALRLIADIFINPGDSALVVSPTFPVFPAAVKMLGGVVKSISLNKAFELPSTESIQNQIDKNTKMIYLANPNNPTGNLIANLQQIEQLLQLNLVVVVDEVYFEFCQFTVTSLLNKYPNLIIVRSFSKGFSLAGLRVGYILTSRSTATYLRSVESTLEPFNIATPSLAGAISALKNYELLSTNIQKVNATRNQLSAALSKAGLTVYPSQATFLMFSLESMGMKSSEFVQNMAQEKILLKDMSIYPNLSEYDCYIAVPKPADLNKVISTINKIIKKRSLV